MRREVQRRQCCVPVQRLLLEGLLRHSLADRWLAAAAEQGGLARRLLNCITCLFLPPHCPVHHTACIIGRLCRQRRGFAPWRSERLLIVSLCSHCSGIEAPSLAELQPADALAHETAAGAADSTDSVQDSGKRGKGSATRNGKAAGAEAAVADAQRAQQAAEAEAAMQALLAEEERAAAAKAQQAQRKVRSNSVATVWKGHAWLNRTAHGVQAHVWAARVVSTVALVLLSLSQAAKRQARKQQQDAAAAAPAPEAQPIASAAGKAPAAPVEPADTADEREAASELGAKAAEAAGLEDDDSATSDATEAAAPVESLPDDQEDGGFTPAKLKRRRGSKPSGAALDAAGGSSTPGVQLKEGVAETAAEQHEQQQEREESDEQLARRLQVGLCTLYLVCESCLQACEL